MKNETNHALEQAKAQYDSIVEMVERLNHCNECRCSYEDYLTDHDECSQFEIIFDTEEEFDEYHDEDAARTAIEEDALSAEVRSGWASSASQFKAEDFMILLCTGGPACRIRGEIGTNSEPERAWLEYQDWGTPWTQYFDASQDILLDYARCFYFET